MLIAGTRLGPYEVVASLGAGGMGEVYKGLDTRVDRAVAIKVLPTDAVIDPEAGERFEREARALASLSHPRVCGLFEYTHFDDRAVLILEYLEGHTLSERLVRGRLTLPEALRISAEIADGLAAAHRAGLVHRDLKPANVMLTKSGSKLLDFGISRPADPPGWSSTDPTRRELTQAGVMVGTLGFMAPEQLTAGPVDYRTDVWAFGCVLYELITGVRAFDGPTPASVAAAILEREPPTPSAVEPAASGPLDRVVRKCLAREPDARWQSAADLRDELRWIAGDGAATAAAPSPQRRTHWKDVLMGAAVAMGLVVAAVALWRPSRSDPAPAPSRLLELTIPRLAAVESLALSPDGSNLAFIVSGAEGVRSVWVRSLSTRVVRPLAGTEGAVAASPPIWSPDGQEIAFVAGSRFRRVNLSSGQIQTIANIEGTIFGGDWSRDGTILVGTYQQSKTHGIHRVPASGGQLAPVTVLEPDVLLHATPKFLRDGRRFMFLEWSFDERRRDTCVASLEQTSVRCLGLHSHFFGGLTDDRIVYSTERRLLAHPYDPATATLTGQPVVVSERIAEDRLGRPSVSVAGSEILVFQPPAYAMRQLMWLDRSGRRVGALGDPAIQAGFDVDAAGTIAAVERLTDDGEHLWLIDGTRGVTTRVDERDVASSPVLSEDGQRLMYLAQREGHSSIVERSVRGGAARVVFDYRGEGVLYLADRSRDGRYALVGKAERNGRAALIAPVDGGEPTLVAQGIQLGGARLSPDGRWLAYVMARTGQPQVFVAPLPATGDEWQVSSAGGNMPQWRGDGRELFYMTPDGLMMSTSVTLTPRFDFSAPKALFRTGLVADQFEQRFAVTGDGSRFLMNLLRDGDKAATTTILQVLLNWPQGLAR